MRMQLLHIQFPGLRHFMNNDRKVLHWQVFVANPNKQESIRSILLRNQDKLVEFLTNFHNDRSEDEQFNDEKAYLIKQIRELKPLEGDQPTPATWTLIIQLALLRLLGYYWCPILLGYTKKCFNKELMGIYVIVMNNYCYYDWLAG